MFPPHLYPERTWLEILPLQDDDYLCTTLIFFANNKHPTPSHYLRWRNCKPGWLECVREPVEFTLTGYQPSCVSLVFWLSLPAASQHFVQNRLLYYWMPMSGSWPSSQWTMEAATRSDKLLAICHLWLALRASCLVWSLLDMIGQKVGFRFLLL